MMAISNRTKIRRVSNRLRRDERRDVLRFESLENRLMLSGSTAHDISLEHIAAGDHITVFSPNVADGLTVAQSEVIPKLNSHLNSLYREFGAHVARAVGVDFAPSDDLLQVNGETVIIDAVASGDVQTLLEDLSRLGLQQASHFGSIVSGFLPISALGQLAAMDSLQFANAALRPWINEGSVTTQGDASMNGVSARGMFGGIDGSGVTVGVLSDSFDTGAGSYATDVASGDLPAGIQVLEDFPGGTDEGRAMAQLIYDVAPGVNFAFHSAFNGMADFANGITELATIGGADVIVDDVIYFEEPMFQDGIIAQAVDAVVASGVSYFSSAGNGGRQSYESVFVDSQVDLVVGTENRGRLHDFDPGLGVDYLQQITVPFFSGFVMSFQWDQPFFSVSGGNGATNDLDIYVLSADGSTILAESITRNEGGDAVEVLQFTNLIFPDPFDPNVGKFNIVISNYSGQMPGAMKYLRYDTGAGVVINEYDTQSGTLFGHANAAGAEAVGAAYYGDTPAFGQNPPLRESFSSAGGTHILFDILGGPLNELRSKPNIVAPDGGDTTFFGQDTDGNGFPNFFGTSAAAPHAAGVAALLLEAHPGRTPAEIYSFLESNAIDMDIAGFDFDTGFGLIQADAALSDSGEAARLSLTIADASIAENGGTTMATVTRRGTDTSGDLVVTITSSDSNQATVDGTVTILDGFASETFVVRAENDDLSDGNQTITISVSAAGLFPGTDKVEILDDEPQFVSQWASSVLEFSSQWTQDPFGGWTAAQALGAPDTLSYGDLATAWAASTVDGTGTEYLTLGYEVPVLATGATIRETWGNGFVTRVEVRDAATQLFQTAWAGTDTSSPGSPVDFSVTWDMTDFYVDALRVTIDSFHVPNEWEEIDAVELRGWTTEPSTIDNLAFAETTVDGSVFGSYTDTHTSDNQREEITEELYGGNRRTRLEQEWDFNVTGGNNVTLIVEAYHDSAVENVIFEYSTDNGASWTPTVTVTNVETTQTFALPDSTSGQLLLRARDTDQSRGETIRDTLYVDQLLIRSSGAGSTVAQVSIAATDDTASENGDTGTFTITRSGITSGVLTVFYSVAGDATTDDDYAPLSGSVIFPDGVPSIDIFVNPVDDGLPEPTETIVLTLQSDPNYTLGAPISANVDILDNDSGGQSVALANGEVTVAGSITQGSYSATWASDATNEVLEEKLSGGKPSNRYSFLEHKWTFEVVSGTSKTFSVEAWSTSVDGDHFNFSYSTDDATYVDLVLVDNPAPKMVYTAALPAMLSGTVYIRVKDTIQTAGNSSRDSIIVDHMFIQTEGTTNGLSSNSTLLAGNARSQSPLRFAPATESFAFTPSDGSSGYVPSGIRDSWRVADGDNVDRDPERGVVRLSNPVTDIRDSFFVNGKYSIGSADHRQESLTDGSTQRGDLDLLDGEFAKILEFELVIENHLYFAHKN